MVANLACAEEIEIDRPASQVTLVVRASAAVIALVRSLDRVLVEDFAGLPEFLIVDGEAFSFDLFVERIFVVEILPER